MSSSQCTVPIPETPGRPEAEKEMKSIPARFLPHKARLRLSMILDPVRDLPDRDYRSFADRSGLTPDIWQWLDSQRIQNDTSSIGKVLKYLIDKHGNSYTIYSVYMTLCDMDSDGQRVILEEMPEIRRMYGAESRPGQEHSEPSSVITPLPSLVPVRNEDPPPPYVSQWAPQSDYVMAQGVRSAPLNNLGAGCQPGKISDSFTDGNHQNGLNMLSAPQRGNAVGASGVQESHADVNPLRPIGYSGGPDACENSCSFSTCSQTTGRGSYSASQPVYDSRVMCTPPPSYLESQCHYSETTPATVQPQMPSTTAMENLKLPLGADCPQIGLGQSVSLEENLLSRPQLEHHHQPLEQHNHQQALIDQPQQVVAHPQGPAAQQGQTTLWNIPPEYALMEEAVEGVGRISLQSSQLSSQRPTSYPTNHPPTYKNHKASSRPISDASFCSHSMAYDCGHQVASWQTSPQSYGPLPSHIGSPGCCGQLSSGGSPVPDSSIPFDGQPWNARHHQTDVKRPLESCGQADRSGCPQPYSNCPRPAGSLEPQGSSMRRNGTNKATSAQRSNKRQPSATECQSSHFVFVLAGDIEETQRLDDEISALCQQLSRYGVPYVVVKSTSDWPLENLPPHIRCTLPPLTQEVQSIEQFVSQCFRKATKVLMMISPGYLLYADEYTKGAKKAVLPQQSQIRRYHELLKTEFFDKKREVFRIWPVLLGRLKANCVHVPTFLSNSVFYSFPQLNGSDNLVELLRLDLVDSPAG